jgi:hypothetical protein
MMMSTIGHMIAVDHRGLQTVISLTQEQLTEIGSDKLPSFPWDLEVHMLVGYFST